MKPRIDTRFSPTAIVSRAGLEAHADVVVAPGDVLQSSTFEGLDCVLVDEAQFLAPAVIDQLRDITLTHNVPVICYGLRTDFRTRLFPGTQRLLELADSIEEVKVTCQFCNRKAVYNIRFIGGKATMRGEQVQLGAEESYAPSCFRCYRDRLPTWADDAR
jgi:thymidine kinase